MNGKKTRIAYGNNPPLRTIMSRTELPSKTNSGIGNRLALVLECGHILIIKKARSPKNKVRCTECDDRKER